MGGHEFGRVLAEIGIESDLGAESPLRYPTMARWTARDTCVITDRCQPANRVIEVDESGTLLWEMHRPPRMNTAVPLEHGRLVVTVNDTVQLIGPGRIPTALATAVDTVFESADVRDRTLVLGSDAGIDMVGLEGGAARRIRPDAADLTNPTGVELLAGGTLLVADAWASRVVELDQAGRRIGAFGRRISEGRGPEFLSGPRSACRTSDGATIVADTLAHRLVEFTPDGSTARVIEVTGHGGLFSPMYVHECDDATLLVADTGNRRVLRVTRTGRVIWMFGPSRVPRRMFSFPRSAEVTAAGRVLVCDALNHRVVEVREKNEIAREYSDGLVIPRSATPASNGRTVIADGVNSRVLVLDERGHPAREVTRILHHGTPVPLQDPHLGRFYGDRLLIVDSDADTVWLVDEHDRSTASWGWRDGLTLRDPHYAAFIRPGVLAITDSGNHRVLVARHVRGSVSRRERLVETGRLPLRYPRFAHPRVGGGFLIADTDHSRIIRVEARETVAAGPILPVSVVASNPEIRTPRWAFPMGGGRVLITDYGNSRIIVAALASSAPGSRSQSGSSAAALTS